jgi:hypothetical protein
VIRSRLPERRRRFYVHSEGTLFAQSRLPPKEATMADKMFGQDVPPRSYSEGLHPQIISANAARGGPLGGRLLAMMIGAILLCVVASAAIEFLYWAHP